LTKDALAACRKAFDEEKPAAPTERQAIEAPEVVSVTPAALNTGIAFSVVLRNHGKDTTSVLLINPVAARHIAACILSGGQQAGWLDERGDIIASSEKLDS
jgi:hypothetical protein